MVKTYDDFVSTIDKRSQELNAIKEHYPELLSVEGKQTADAYWDLMWCADFHEDFKSYASDEGVRKILEEYKDCRYIATIARFLAKQTEGGV